MATMTKSRKARGKKLRPAIIKLWREQMGFTQKEGALALGCSREAFQGWEHGRHRIPTYIGLAMAALTIDMRPFGTYDEA